MVLRPTTSVPTANVTDPTIEEMRHKIAELEQQVQLQSKRSTAAPITTTSTATPPAQDTRTPPEIFRERRRRNLILTFRNGDATEAQRWLEKYTRLCTYLGFTEEKKIG